MGLTIFQSKKQMIVEGDAEEESELKVTCMYYAWQENGQCHPEWDYIRAEGKKVKNIAFYT